MSAPVQGRPSRGYGKSTQYPPGNRYGHSERNLGGSRRESIPPSRQENVPPVREKNIPFAKHENICAEPPSWLDSYLQHFKKTLISEITDDVMRALDASYKNDTDKRRFKANYFALKKRLTNLEAQHNAGDLQQQRSESQSTTPRVNNDENKTQEKFYRPRNGRNGSYNKRSDEPTTSSSNGTNVNFTASSSSTSQCLNGKEDERDEPPAYEHVRENIVERTKINEYTSLPNVVITDADIINELCGKTIVEGEQNDEESLQELTSSSGPADHTANEKCTPTENTQPLKEIFKLLDDGKSDEPSATTADHLAVDDGEIDKTLCKKVQSMLNKLTPESFDVLCKQIEDLDMDTPEKQQEVINVFLERARSETMYSVVYAQMCKRFAVEHECISTFRETLITRCDLEMMYHKETEKKKIKEQDNADDEEETKEIKAESDQKSSNEFLGALLFMGELYNQDLLTDTVMEKCLQYLLQNNTESGLKYLCHVLQLVGKHLISRERSITPYMNHLVESRESSEVSASLTLLINSLMELMSNNWEPLVPHGSSELADFEGATDE